MDLDSGDHRLGEVGDDHRGRLRPPSGSGHRNRGAIAWPPPCPFSSYLSLSLFDGGREKVGHFYGGGAPIPTITAWSRSPVTFVVVCDLTGAVATEIGGHRSFPSFSILSGTFRKFHTWRWEKEKA
ncbi:hypothetical protein CRG98_007943 [Punica granatum]|uniref:Uncharacterized protein n=1 Tax=Punica granatum TaxID=22663 RepID=A0A2I0KTG3_PUNGR|nr:hypothetical protein CRG98_007943 [Punica granatum]